MLHLQKQATQTLRHIPSSRCSSVLYRIVACGSLPQQNFDSENRFALFFAQNDRLIVCLVVLASHRGMPRTSSPTKGMCFIILFSTKPLKIRKKFSLPLAKGIFLCYTICNKIYLIKSNVVTGTMMLQQPAFPSKVLNPVR